ncbi:Deleted in malignant brain tumors 1 protein, partial [Tinamus guttatus]
LRLVGGRDNCTGRVEVFYNHEWGTVCDDNWDMNDAMVVCRQLGCGMAVSAPGSAHFGWGSYRIWLDDVNCNGTETDLSECKTKSWGVHNCHHGEDAGVVCLGLSRRDAVHAASLGVLSLQLSTICVSCPWSSLQCAAPQTRFPIRQMSESLLPLLRNLFTVTIMISPKAEKTSSTDLRLVSGPNRCAGRVEVLHKEQWGTVCDDTWDLHDATVVCQQLGCGRAQSAPTGAHFGQGSGPIWLDDVSCIGTEDALSQCRSRPWGQNNCNHGEDASVVCSGISKTSKLRLVGGRDNCTGRVEVFYNHEWGTVCDDNWDMNDAMVVCRQLGCGMAVSAPGSAHFGWGSYRIWLDDVNCNGTETDLSECKTKSWGVHNCHHGEDAGVVCLGLSRRDAVHAASLGVLSLQLSTICVSCPWSSLQCAAPQTRFPIRQMSEKTSSTDLRLVSGPNRCAGRVEVLHKEQWGTVCDDTWDLHDATVVCQQLGCGRAQSAPTGAHFGQGSGPIWLDDVSCVGTEDALSQCRSRPWGQNNCNHGEDASVVCSG